MNSSAPKSKRVLWSPRGKDQFMVGSNDLRLYDYDKDSKSFKMVAVNSDVSLMKCFSWYPGMEVDDLVAVGLTNGKTVLTRLGGSADSDCRMSTLSPSMTALNDENESLLGSNVFNASVESKYLAEYVPRYSRACNVALFSSTHSNLLSCGLDKVRNDHSLFVWDISGSLQSNASEPYTQPLRQYGSSEAVTSVSWLKTCPYLLGAGMGLKWMRWYDIRQESSPAIVIGTRSVYGIQVDPLNRFRFASFSDEGIINIFDMRKYSDSLLSISGPVVNEGKSGCVRISFSSKRAGMLAALYKETKRLHVFDIQNGPSINDITYIEDDIYINSLPEEEQSELKNANKQQPFSQPLLWRSRQTKEFNASLSSFAWIPSDENKFEMLVASRSGLFHVVDVKEPAKIAWDHKSSSLVMSEDSSVNFKSVDDISEIMKQRAMHGYGLDLILNYEISKFDVWKHLARFETLFRESDVRDHINDLKELIYMGAYTAAKVSSVVKRKMPRTSPPKAFNEDKYSSMNTGLTTAAMAYTANLNHQTSFTPMIPGSGASNLNYSQYNDPVYNGHFQTSYDRLTALSEDVFVTMYPYRTLALELCGHNWRVLDPVGRTLKRFEEAREFDRAAAWALLFGNVTSAIRILQASKDEKYQFIAAALSTGFPPPVTANLSTWTELCRNLSMNLTQPFLKAIFKFVSSGGSHSLVVKEQDLPLEDRIALAVRFLQDDELVHFFHGLCEEFIRKGDLNGILVTGFSFPACSRLLSSYLDKTGDIQTCAIIMSCCPQPCFVGTCSILNEYEIEGCTEKAATNLVEWVHVYEQMMNQWRLFKERCKFEMGRRRKFANSKLSKDAINSQILQSEFSKYFSNTRSNPKYGQTAIEQVLNIAYGVTSQVFIRCNFCNQSLSGNQIVLPSVMGTVDSGRTALLTRNIMSQQSLTNLTSPGPGVHNQVSQRIKYMACPSCKKQLPKCSICLLPIGMEITERTSGLSQSITKIDSWFAWCQTCRHGGHSMHISQWFKSHSVCPVSGCNCKCSLAS